MSSKEFTEALLSYLSYYSLCYSTLRVMIVYSYSVVGANPFNSTDSETT